MKKRVFIVLIISLSFLILLTIFNVFNKFNDTNIKNKEYMNSIISNSKKVKKVQLIDKSAKKIIYADKYNMDLSLDVDKKIISGRSKIRIINNFSDEVSYIILRNYTANVYKKDSDETSVVNNFKDNENNKLKSSISNDATVIKVNLFKSLKPKEEMELSFDFQSDIPKQKNRFGYYTFEDNIIFQLSFCFPVLSIYENGEWNKSPYIIDGAESNYTTVADYSVKVLVPSDYTVVATGIENKSNNVYNISAKNLREFAMVIGNNLTKKTVKYNGININNYFYNYNGNKEYINYTLDTMKESLELYSNLIGNYPYEELDLVNVFINSAMEYPGLIMLGYPDIQLKKIKNIDKYKCYDHVLHHVSHEVAHQWFYGAVGNDPYDEPWLDEGFAEFFESYVFPISGSHVIEKAASEKNEQIESVVEFKKLKNIFLDQTNHDKSINLSYDKYSKKDDEYSYYVYNSGAMLLYELEQFFGENKFFSILQSYYNNYKFSEVKTSDFVNFIEMYDDSDKVKAIINKYISI